MVWFSILEINDNTKIDGEIPRRLQTIVTPAGSAPDLQGTLFHNKTNYRGSQTFPKKQF